MKTCARQIIAILAYMPSIMPIKEEEMRTRQVALVHVSVGI